MIPDDVVDRVRNEADIISIVGEFVKLKRVGNSFRGPCPFHGGTHDNFAVSPRGGYVCFVCGEKGDVFTFAQKHFGLDFVEAVKWVGARAGVDVVEVSHRAVGPDPREPLWEINAAAAEYFQQVLTGDDGAHARQYLASRTLDLAEADRFAIGYAPRDPGALRQYLGSLGYDDARQLAAGLLVEREETHELRARFRDRLMFPIHDVQGHVVGFGGRVMGQGEPKYLNSAESDVFAKRRLLYGLHWARHAIRKADRLIIVEGYFDVIRTMIAGIEEVVAPLGTALTEAQASLIRKYTKSVYLLYDSDAAGQKATFRAADELLRNGVTVRVITLPDGEDPDTFVAKFGAEGLEEAIADAVDVFDRKVQILRRGGWFADLRRKREALDKLLPTIRATADRLTRDLYLATASEAAGIAREALERELALAPAGGRGPAPDSAGDDEGQPGDARQVRQAQRRMDHRGEAVSAEREIVRAMLHIPDRIEEIGERIGADSFLHPVYRAIFTELVSLGASATPEDVAAALDEGGIAELTRLLDEAGGLEMADAVIDGSIIALRRRVLSMELEQLDRDLPLATGEEQDELLRTKRLRMNEMQSLKSNRYKAFSRRSGT